MKRRSTLLIITEMQIKTTMRYHLTLARMAIIKNSQTINTGEGVERREPSYTVGRNVNWRNHHGEQHGVSLKKLTIELPYCGKLWEVPYCSETLQSHSWANIQRQTCSERIHAPQYSLQHCL